MILSSETFRHVLNYIMYNICNDKMKKKIIEFFFLLLQLVAGQFNLATILFCRVLSCRIIKFSKNATVDLVDAYESTRIKASRLVALVTLFRLTINFNFVKMLILSDEIYVRNNS